MHYEGHIGVTFQNSSPLLNCMLILQRCLDHLFGISKRYLAMRTEGDRHGLVDVDNLDNGTGVHAQELAALRMP
jgi:hypothetical protein